jgi:tetratricopeptide (TPR) repeat protein
VPACPYCSNELTPLRRGGFLCEECERRFDDAVASMARPTAAVGPQWDDPSMPFAIAAPLARARDPRASLASRLDAATFAAYQAVRLTGTLLFADYLSSTATSRKIGLAARALRAPDWWAWTVLANQVCRFFAGDLDVPPDREPSFPKLVTGWRSVNRKSAVKKDTKWATLLEGLDGREGQATSANDALWRAREDIDEQRRRGIDPSDEGRLVKLLSVVEATTARLFPKDAIELLRFVDRAGKAVRLARLHGAHLDGRFPLEIRSEEWGEPFLTTPVVAITDGATVPLSPLLLRLDPETRAAAFAGGGGMLERLTVDRTGRTASLGGRSPAPRVIAAGTAAMRAKGIDTAIAPADVSLPALVPWATAATESAVAVLAPDALGERHVHRAGIDDVAESVLSTPGRALLIVGGPGSGKTHLAARLAGRAARFGPAPASREAPLAAPASDLVLFVSGRAALQDGKRPAAELLARALCRVAGVRDEVFPTAATLFDAIARGDGPDGRRVIVVLDAVDEVDDVTGMLAAIDDLIATVATYPFVRLVMTMREGTARGARPLSNAHLLLHFHERGAGGLVPWLALRPYDDDEASAAYQAIARSSALAWTALPARTKRILSTPIWLSLYRELPTQPADLDEPSLIDAHLAAESAKARRFAEAAPALAAAIAASRNDLALDPAKSEPAATLVTLGVMAPPPDDGRPSGLATYVRGVILEELVARALGVGDPPSGEVLARLATETAHDASPHRPFVRAATRLCARLAVEGQGTALAWLLTAPGSGGTMLLSALVALASAWVEPDGGPEVRAVLDALATTAAEPLYADRLVPVARTASRVLASRGDEGAARAVEGLALRTLRARASLEPEDEALARELAASLGTMSRLARRAGRPDESRKLSNEALAVVRALAVRDPEDPARRAEVVVALLASANASHERAPRDEKRLLAEAELITRGPSDETLATLRADVLDVLADRSLEAGEPRVALQVLTESLPLRHRLAATIPRDDRLAHLAATARRAGEARIAAGDPATAARHLEDAVSTLRAVIAREPYFLAAHRDLYRSLGLLGELARSAGNRDEAGRLLDEALDGLSWLAAGSPTTTVRGDLAQVLHMSGELALLEGKRGRARKLLTACIEHTRALPGLDHTLSSALSALGHVARAEGRHAEARGHYAEAIRLAAPLVAEGKSEDRVVALADLYLSASLVEADPAGKKRMLGQVRELLAPLRPRAEVGSKLARLLDIAERALADA